MKLQGWLCATLALLGFAAQAQDAAFPNRALRIVVPTSPGSGSDTTARFFGEQLATLLGQPVVVDNKPGANGVIAAMAVKAAPADGYTLFLGTNTHMAVNPIVVKNLQYDAVKDFKFVAGLARGMMIFVTSPNSKLGSAKELVAASKSASKELTVGSYTSGFHLSAEWFAAMSGTRHVYINYKGAPEVFTALMGDQLDWAVTDLIAAVPQVKAGKLKAIGVTGETRNPTIPDVPTMIEGGLPDFVSMSFTGLVAPAGTPPAMIKRVSDVLESGLATVEVRTVMEKLGVIPMPGTPADFGAFLARESIKWRTVAKNAGIKITN